MNFSPGQEHLVQQGHRVVVERFTAQILFLESLRLVAGVAAEPQGRLQDPQQFDDQNRIPVGIRAQRSENCFEMYVVEEKFQ